MISSVTEQSLTELNSAILGKDGAAFAKAYGDLTDACNSCHRALNHAVVQIRVPSSKSASDPNWLTHTPPALVAQHLNIEEATIAKWPHDGPGVMPNS